MSVDTSATSEMSLDLADRSSTSNQSVCVLMPVYNERYRVADAVREVLEAPWPSGFERRLIIVDDGSTDGTREILLGLADEHPEHIRLVMHAQNRGKGAAIRTAIENAEGDYALIQDADLEYDPADCGPMIELLASGKADVVYGSRFASSPKRRVLYFWHALGNRALTLLCNMVADLNLTDMETGYKAFRLELLKSIPIRCDRFGVEPELTLKVAKRGMTIYEVPVSYYGRTYSEGKKITAWDGVKAIATILRFWLIDDLYNEQYGHAILHRLAGAHRFNRWMADTIKPYVGQKVLEIGAGIGNLSVRLLPRNEYAASDIDPLHLRYLTSRFERHPHVQVYKTDLTDPRDFRDLAGQFDTAICLNVVEHVDDDRTALQNLWTALAPGGRAVVLVPRGKWLFGSLDEVLEHRRRYDRQELIDVAQQAGFEIEEIFDFNRAGVPGWYLNARLLQRKHFGRVQLKIYDSLMWLIRRIDRLWPWRGLSWIAILKK